MEKSKRYRAWFPPEVIKEARDLLQRGTGSKMRKAHRLTIEDGNEDWTYDDEEHFFGKYRSKSYQTASYMADLEKSDRVAGWIRLFQKGLFVRVNIGAPSEALVAQVSDVFERELPKCMFAEPVEAPTPKVKPRIFIGHGRSKL